MPLLDLLLSMFWIFLFILWIWLVITVFIDIFRSDDLSGWAKALWVIFVIFLPLLGVLIYVIARGDKMQQRRYDDAVAQQRRNLVAQRLAAAGGHQHQRILAGDQAVDDIFLLKTKRVVTEAVA